MKYFSIVLCLFVSLANAENCFYNLKYQKCYFTPDNEYRNYYAAKKYCDENRAELIQPSSRDELDWIRLNVQPYPWRWFWLGTSTSANKEFPTHFLNGSKIEYPFLGHNASNSRICNLVTNESPTALAGTWSSNKPWFLQNVWQPEITICQRLLVVSNVFVS